MMRSIFHLSLICLICIFNRVWAYNIVFYLNAAAHTHLDYASVLIDALVERGHNVDLIIGRINPLVTKNGTAKTRRVIEFFLPKTESWVKKSHLANPFSEDISILRNIPWRYSARHTFAVGAMALCEVGIKSGEPLKFLKEGGYDIGLTSDYDSCGAILMHQARIPSIGSFLATTFLPMEIQTHGLPMAAGAFQDLQFQPDLDLNNNIWHRLWNSILCTLRVFDERSSVINVQTSLARSYYGADFPEVDKIGANFDVAFVNTVDLLESTRVTTGKIKHIGGIAIKQPKKLDEELEEIVSTLSYKGVVVFTFGTQIQTEQMPQKIRRAFAQAFASFPEYAFLWKYDSMPDDDVVFSGVSNVFRFKWLPQRDLLAHNRTVAFISHMGLNSYMEAAFSGVPILAVPIFTDQFHNTRTAVKRGVAFKVNKNNITFDSIKYGLEEILHNPKYRESSKRVKKMLNDRPENSKEIFVKWVEFAASNPGLHEYLNLPGNDMSPIKYYCLDIFFYAILLFLTIVYFVLKLLRVVIHKLKGSDKKLKTKNE